MDVETGAVVDSVAANRSLPPASVTKAITAGFGLKSLGADHVFTTQLIAVGDVVDGQLQGDLILQGGGDPTLHTDQLVDMARALEAAGIWDVTGRFLVSDAGFPFLREIDPSQPPQVGYNPAVSGINLNFNRVRFDWARQSGGRYDMSMRAAGEQYRPYIPFSRIIAEDRTSPNYTHRLMGDGELWTVRKSALGAKGGRWLPTRIPRIYAGEALRGICRTSSIVLPRPEISNDTFDGQVIHTARSAAYTDVARDMLKYSTNLTAEAIGFSASAMPDLPQSAAALSAFARENGMTGSFADHSGLSDQSRVSPMGLARFMVAQRETGLRDILKVMPLRENNVALPGVILQAKTGSLNFVSTLAGYVTVESKTMAFAIMTADLTKRAAIKPEDRERPDGGGYWAQQSRSLQYSLLRNWLGHLT
ncbi:MAG: D-alanyl-D-alanine carboxypeptidase/D-alanyl-D-alanine endopeptidase, partial [Planktomarina sp.]